MPEIQLDQLDDPRLLPYRDLKKTNLTRWSGQFIAEGIRVVERLLASGLQIESVLITQEQRHRLPAEMGQRTTVLVVPQSLAELIVGYRFHAGVLACARRPDNPELRSLVARTSDRSLLIGCPQTTDPDNLGNIIRIGAAFGISGLLAGQETADLYSRRTLRVSMGNAFQLPMRLSDDFAADLRQLQSQGYQIVASCLSPQAIPLREFVPSSRMVLLLGNEANGLEETLLQLADQQVVIPMAAGVDSLNVSIATGILLYELTR
ncbi:TrmH family RNA methyltransferase [Planctomicrobium sp. SH664]|uniref:TrmH family RNA methyltransferase n=1 Tax=Planctomicrobium sp. SH664 TaxID=3448125 RepID=UPI003F5CA70F